MPEAAAGTAAALTRLTEVSRALTYAASLEEVLDITVECALDLLAAPRAVLMLQDDDGLLRIRAARGVPDELVDRFKEPLDESLVSRLEAVLGPEARDGFLGVPLVVKGSVIGLLAVLRADPFQGTQREEWLLSALADQASVGLDHARREQEGAGEPTSGGALERPAFSRDDTLRMITHDLRTPLSALHGYLHLLESGLYGALSEPQRAAVARLQAVSRHLQGLVSDVVEAGQLAAGTLAVDCRAVELGPVAEEAAAMVELDAREHGVRVVLDTPPGLQVHGEPDRLRQVLVHLLENAVRFAPERTEITLTGDREGDGEVVVRVRDRGPGIPAEQAEAVFRPYHRLEAERGGGGGLGLGLAITRSLVGLMGGSVEVAPDVTDGTCFVIRLREP